MYKCRFKKLQIDHFSVQNLFLENCFLLWYVSEEVPCHQAMYEEQKEFIFPEVKKKMETEVKTTEER